MSEPLMVFTSHVEGKNAKVAVFPDRVEWSREGSQVARWTAATVTLGASLLGGKKSEVHTIPVRAITSVTAKRDGLVNSLVSVSSPSGTVAFRVSHREADALRSQLLSLVAAS